jgi:Rieske Fe-S protein
MKRVENLQARDTRMNLQRCRVSIASTTIVATTDLGPLGFPFIVSWRPSVRVHLDGAPVVTVDDSKLQPGQQIVSDTLIEVGIVFCHEALPANGYL